MASPMFVFIATKTTADFVVPVSAASQSEFNRKVANAFQGQVGGVLRAGDLKFRPIETAIPNHLLCDGQTITRTQFPQLVDVLNPGGSTATLPDYTGSVEAAAPTETQVISDGGTVSTGTPTPTPPPSGGTGGTTGGNVPSGGRPLRQDAVAEN